MPEPTQQSIPKYLQIIIIVGALLLVTATALITYKVVEISDRQKRIEDEVTKQKELSDNIWRSQTEFATRKDLESFIKSNGVNVDVVKKDLDKLQADIAAANVLIFKSLGSFRTDLPGIPGVINTSYNTPVCSDGTVCPDIDKYKYFSREDIYPLVENFGKIQVPIGKVGFSAWKEKPWSEYLLPRDYKVTNIVATDENERIYFYNKVIIKTDDKEYEIPIYQANVKQQYPEAKWSFWNPRLFLGADGGVGVNPVQGEFIPSLSLGIMSYGKFKTNPDFSVLQVGAGYGVVSQMFKFSFTPFAYNVGQHLPFMKNLYLGPSVHVSTDGNVNIMAGVRVGL